ncbi:MAG TPA: hypothetical protein VMF70_08210 [Gemmatimonadales bacterium]|nr:hypothetical protein [Gemmatimonadales bacterium]
MKNANLMKIALPAAALAIALVTGRSAQGQNPTPSPADTGAPMGNAMRRPGLRGGERAEQLRGMIEERFAQRVKVELGLTDQQLDRLRGAMRADRDRRMHLRDREQDLRGAIYEQMRPGVAANQDSLSRLQDALVQNHLARAQLEQQNERELAQFLTPVQRARLLQMRAMLMQRIQTIREGRWRQPAGRPGLRGQPPADSPGPGPR